MGFEAYMSGMPAFLAILWWKTPVSGMCPIGMCTNATVLVKVSIQGTFAKTIPNMIYTIHIHPDCYA